MGRVGKSCALAAVAIMLLTSNADKSLMAPMKPSLSTRLRTLPGVLYVNKLTFCVLQTNGPEISG